MSRTAAEVPCTVIRNDDQLGDLGQAIGVASRIAIDTETPIDGPSAGRMRVMSIAVRSQNGERAFVVDARDLDPTRLAPMLTGVVADAWNANFDARVIDDAVWRSTDTTDDITWWDAQLADALLYQGRSGFNFFHGLAWAIEHYLGLRADGKGTVQLSYTPHDDLTDEQVAYAAADAVHTLWVADAIRAEIAAARLEEICQIEQAARPFLDQMERTGLPFDWSGWKRELTEIDRQRRESLGRLAQLTGGGQGTLFDEIVEPNWNPASDNHVRRTLNRWAEAEVQMWTEAREGSPRLLDDGDSVRAGVLREIGGPLCEELLHYRDLAKILSTYGDSIGEHVDADGRIRPQYLQVVGTNTGRLASVNPNAQNFTPRMKPHIRPSAERVFVHADLSQAELRYLAQVAEDGPLREAFARGDDVHASTAATMFGFDPTVLRSADPGRFERLRQIAKALNFGIAYGSGAASLARTLTAEGNPTSPDEAAELLAAYRRTYPGTTEWAERRIAEIATISQETAVIDWELSLRLARGFRDVHAIRRDLRQTQGRWPTPDEILDRHPDRLDHPGLASEIEWLLRYPAPVALVTGGEPFRFSSRTLAGRRQQFELHLDRLLLSAAIAAVRSSEPGFERVRSRFGRDHGVDLREPTGHVLEQLFENR